VIETSNPSDTVAAVKARLLELKSKLQEQNSRHTNEDLGIYVHKEAGSLLCVIPDSPRASIRQVSNQSVAILSVGDNAQALAGKGWAGLTDEPFGPQRGPVKTDMEIFQDEANYVRFP